MAFRAVHHQDFDATINKIIQDHTSQSAHETTKNVGSLPAKGPIKWPSNVPEELLIHVCAKCGMEFGHGLYFEQHLNNIHAELQSAEDLKMHILSKSDAECLICGVQVKHHSVRELQVHHFRHLQYKPYKCKCHGHHFNDRASAILHLLYKRNRNPASGESLTKQEILSITNGKVEEGYAFNPQYPETGIGYTCSECGIHFSCEDEWKRHCNDEHDFQTLEGLNMTMIDSSMARCNECDAAITGKWDKYKLRRHKLTHSPFRAFFCRLCKYSRKRKDDVLHHIRHAHSSERKKYF